MSAQLTIFGTLEADYTVKPWRDPGVTRVYPEPAAARNETLEALAERRAVLVAAASRVALELAARDGVVTAPRVLREMRRRGLHDEACDPRYLGAVLLPSRGWMRTGELVAEGSKHRPVPVWKRAA